MVQSHAVGTGGLPFVNRAMGKRMDQQGRHTRPFPRRRRAVVDAMRAASRRNDVHGLVEFDVTDARRRVRAEATDIGESRSFTAFIVYCLSRALEDHPDCNSYRDWRGRLVHFDDVDVMVVVETTLEGEHHALPHVVRAANRRSLESIHDEIRAAQASPAPMHTSWLTGLGLRLPGPIRRLFYRLPRWFPGRWKQVAGTVGVTALGMFGTGSGWGVTPTNYTLQLTVGGIGERPALVDGAVEPREYLSLTVTVDHDVVDGAPAARFTERLRELVEGAHGLDV